MEINRDGTLIFMENKSDPDNTVGPELVGTELSSSSSSLVLRTTLLLERVGEVVLTYNSHGLFWELLDSSQEDESCCLGKRIVPKSENGIKFAEVYGVDFIGYGLIRRSNLSNIGKRFLDREPHDAEMYRFTVHGAMKSHTQHGFWALAVYTFGHTDLQICKAWVDRISASLVTEVGRPKKLLVFVHPLSGKANGSRTWETVAPIFSRAKVETEVIVTQRAGHAFDVMASTTNKKLNTYDGVIVVGGDGFFNEVLNGFLLSRHKAPYPPSPADFVHSDPSNGHAIIDTPIETVTEPAHHNEDLSPLLSNSTHNGAGLANSSSDNGSSSKTADQDIEFPLPSDWFRLGIIPAGSTDAIVMCTTGTRDPITSALQIVLGKRVSLDVAQVVRWKTTSTSVIEPCVRYAASFAGYGFYGDVIKESEKYRWMGPNRYDYAGTKIFLRHRSYEAEVAYIETESEESNSTVEKSHLLDSLKLMLGQVKSERVICRMNCGVCNKKPLYPSKRSAGVTPYYPPEETRWLRSKGHFLSVGAAIISNRNERAPDGLVADAHLSDGLLHLLLIRDCPHALYLWHLTQLAKRGGRPLNFKFVEHHKTPAFTFTSFGKESVWNLDGELFPAHKLSAQVFRGLVSLFATGPEV